MQNNEANGTKYMQCYKNISSYIKENQLIDGDKLPTESQLTDMLGVSRITIRKALSLLEEDGIVHSIHGSGTFVGTKETANKQITYIPLILPGEAGEDELYDTIRGADKYLSENSFYLTVHFSNRDVAEERNIVSQLVENGAKCIIIFLCDESENQSFFSEMERNGIHFIFLDRMPKNISGSFVRSDNVKGGYIATQHLINQGYKRIAFISRTAEPEAYSLTQRLAGYCSALEENGLPYNEKYISFDRPNADFNDRLELLMALEEKPDAIFCANDMAAIDAVYGLETISMSVPGDVAIIGFDNSNQLNNLPLSISTISQSFYDIGYEAAEIACSYFNSNINYDVHKILPVELIVRDSTAKKSAEIKDDN